MHTSAPQSKNAVLANIKYSRYIHLMLNFLSIYFHTKRLYVNMFDIVDTLFIWKRVDRLLITFQDKRKYFACDLNVDTAF